MSRSNSLNYIKVPVNSDLYLVFFNEDHSIQSIVYYKGNMSGNGVSIAIDDLDHFAVNKISNALIDLHNARSKRKANS